MKNNFFKNIISIGRKSVTREGESNENAGWTIIGGGSESTRINKNNLMDANKNWVFVAVKKIASNVAQSRMKLLTYNKDGEDEEIFESPVLDLLSRPNKYLTGKQFTEITWSHLELTGNAYWLMKKTGQKVTELFPMNPKNMTLIWNDVRTEVISYKYTVGTKVKEYQAEEIFHLKIPDLSNPLIGQGTLEGLAEWVDVDNYITEFNRRFFINGATFGSAIETEASSQTTLETLKAQVRDAYTGVKNAFKVFILPKGSKFVESKMTMKDMDMSEGDSRYRDKILSGFGVPKSVLGITEAGSSRADAEAKNYAFQEFTIKPKLTFYYDYLTEFFIPVIDKSNAKTQYLSFEDPTPENKEAKLKEDQVGLNNQAFLTVNEVRASRGLAPVAGGDRVLFTMNGIPLDMTDEEDNTGEPTQNSIKNPFIKKTPRILKKTTDDFTAKIAERAANFIATKAKKEEGTIDDRRKIFGEEHKEFVARVTRYEDEVKLAFVHFDKNQMQTAIKNLQQRMKAHTKGIDGKDIVDYDASVGAIIDFATPLLGGLFEDQAKNAARKVSNEFTFSFNASAKKVLDASIKRMAKKYTKTTLQLLSFQLAEGLNAGESLDQLTDRVRGVYGLTEEYRAARVARTETFSVANDASRQAYIQSGVVKSVEWFTAEDELVCEYCGPLDGKIIGVTDNFYTKGDVVEGANGGKMNLDYETIVNPPLHANCRCEIKPSEISVKSEHDHEHKTEEGDDDISFLQKMINVLEHDEN